ncbi:hypothetical protein M0L20_28530 [Spirosoma sp. RP8]|uniref:Uncharacterized protein n=1 Tax=Spirosoma liriopis TaxID=2937440 RepID=A0ABT0HUH7_9BACT|nr:hypothetical protein [Spirosoma liriopis]MCK8495846.1 hypothetical protein [Spirosoma liriopis]
MAYKHVDTDTAEVSFSIKYLTGRPRQYRFNGQTGRFNINGITDVGNSLTIQPIVWRIFTENLFARGKNELWAELFFVDSANALCSIMFNNSSVNELYNLIETLFYDDLSLADVVLTITSEKKAFEKEQTKGTWHLAKFGFVLADPATVAELGEFARSVDIFRADTITETAVYHLVSDTFPKPLQTIPVAVEPAQLPAPANV